ncbi:MAG: hypothetical protein N2D54_11100, partial [Chloroflexota bacterium]
FIRKDSGVWEHTAWTLLQKKPNAVEIDWKASTNPGDPNGFIKLYLNDNLKVKKLKINNDTHTINSVRLGITQNLAPTSNISGHFYLDAFASDATTHIGP